jgi:hypothetical protein
VDGRMSCWASADHHHDDDNNVITMRMMTDLQQMMSEGRQVSGDGQCGLLDATGGEWWTCRADDEAHNRKLAYRGDPVCLIFSALVCLFCSVLFSLSLYQWSAACACLSCLCAY